MPGFRSTSGLWPINLRANFTAPPKNRPVTSIHRHTQTTNTFTVKKSVIRLQWKGHLSNWSNKCARHYPPETSLACADKAAAPLFSVRGSRRRAFEPKRDSVCECAFCLSACYFFVRAPFIPAETPHCHLRGRERPLSPRAAGAGCPRHPCRPPFEFFSICSRCESWNGFVSAIALGVDKSCLSSALIGCLCLCVFGVWAIFSSSYRCEGIVLFFWRPFWTQLLEISPAFHIYGGMNYFSFNRPSQLRCVQLSVFYRSQLRLF